MKTLHDLVVRLLQEARDGATKVIARDRHGKLYVIEAIDQCAVHCPGIMASMKGPLEHNEAILVLDVKEFTQPTLEVI